MLHDNPIPEQDAFYGMLRETIPKDVSLSELEPFAPRELWQLNPGAALALALKESPRINWRAYTCRYMDVKDSGMDPFVHYINHGIYEGRKLASWHPLKEPQSTHVPLVSVCIVNYNNALYVDKCLDSVCAQSLEDIEIIVVDDASTDASAEIIKRYARKDSRLKPVYKKNNQGTFKARKDALESASGEYVMFLDSDDYLDTRACEIAWNRIATGYDIVEFCFLVNKAARTDDSRIINCQAYADGESAGEYMGSEIINNIFNKRLLRWNLCGKIFLRELCVAALADTGDGFDVNVEDLYAMAAIAARARSLLKIPDRLYIYNFGIGYSTGEPSGELLDRWFSLGSTVAKIGDYAASRGLDIGFERIKIDMLTVSLERWIYAVPPDRAGKYWNVLKDQYGVECLIEVLASRFKNRIIPLANQFRNCVRFDLSAAVTPKRIGLYYQRLTQGGAQTVIGAMARAMIAQGLEVVIFSEETHSEQISLPEEVKIVYLNCGSNDAARLARILACRVGENPVDLMIYASMGNPNLIWALIGLHECGVPVIINYHGDFSLAYSTPNRPFNHHEQNAVFGCAHAVTCLSRASELWLRVAGINAWRLPNEIKAHLTDGSTHDYNIAVLGRLGDPVKQIGQSLMVLREIIRTIPAARLICIGDFGTEEQKNKFWNMVSGMGLQSNVSLTGWTNEPERYLAQCAILLSTSWWESFALAVGEAQALGLPCVIYDVAIEQAIDNPSIISVVQGDYKAAARAAISLLEDGALRRNLGEMAKRKAARYSETHFRADLAALITRYGSSSPWTPPDKSLYEYIIKYAGFYGGRQWPENGFDMGDSGGNGR